jgi:lipopolysaccharide/colanic/teichoic acid biosynthesis glycosyltransferase
MAVMIGDVVVILLGYAIALLVRSDARDLFSVVAVTVPLYLGTALNAHGFAVSTLKGPGCIATPVRSLLLSDAALFLLVYFIHPAAAVPRLMLLVALLTSLILLVVFRRLVSLYIRRYLKARLTAEMVIFDGVRPDMPASMIAIDAEQSGIVPDLANPGVLNRFAELVRDMDRVVVACQPASRAGWSMMLKGANVLGEVIVDDMAPVGAFGMGSVAEHTTLLVASGPLTLSDRFLKRTFDLVLCAPALVVLAPVLLLTAVAVKLDSRGPVFFRQRRVGRGNAFFEILKFRSMHVAESDSDGSVSTGRGDRRVTRVGRLIRSTSIDELPQLFNVLSGSMSLVGPRPHALGSLAGSQLFWEVDDRYWHRHACKPGLTGLAQVRGFRGATHRREDLVNRLQADLEYLNGWNIWRDISILFATLKVVMHRNAF